MELFKYEHVTKGYNNDRGMMVFGQVCRLPSQIIQGWECLVTSAPGPRVCIWRNSCTRQSDMRHWKVARKAVCHIYKPNYSILIGFRAQG
jgi:hypothetical protein